MCARVDWISEDHLRERECVCVCVCVCYHDLGDLKNGSISLDFGGKEREREGEKCRVGHVAAVRVLA